MWFLAGSSKWILILLIVLGAEYLSYVKFIATYALTFFVYNKVSLENIEKM